MKVSALYAKWHVFNPYCRKNCIIIILIVTIPYVTQFGSCYTNDILYHLE